jgi:hypothetical protein
MKLIEQENGQALVLLRKINRTKEREQQLEIELIKSPINKKINKMLKQIELSQVELKKICTHSKKSQKDDYIGGSYYDREQFIKITVCDICGQELDREVTLGGYG